MKIEKGIVKYKDRSDLVCTYGTTDDGTKYYFLDENDVKKFSNGNRIVSSLLVEAIDPMVKASNIGVIDGNGVVVIPCVNRSIRVVDDSTILVESSVPVTQSVIDACELRNDPLAATKLVSTPATIKDRVNAQMGTEGKYLFNDQFSEVTVCDIDGNNLVDNEYYSFVAQANGKLYMSKNTVDSEIKEYVLGMGSTLDVSSVSIDQSVVENALGVPSENIEELTEEAQTVPAADDAMPYGDVTAAEDVSIPNSSEVLDETIPANDEELDVAPDFPTAEDTSVSGDDVIPYNDEVSTVVDESMNSSNEGIGGFVPVEVNNDMTYPVEGEVVASVPDGSSYDFNVVAADDVVQENTAPSFMDSAPAPSPVDNLPTPEESLGAETGFGYTPSDMDAVMPYNDASSIVTDEAVEPTHEEEKEDTVGENAPVAMETHEEESDVVESLPTDEVLNNQTEEVVNNMDGEVVNENQDIPALPIAEDPDENDSIVESELSIPVVEDTNVEVSTLSSDEEVKEEVVEVPNPDLNEEVSVPEVAEDTTSDVNEEVSVQEVADDTIPEVSEDVSTYEGKEEVSEVPVLPSSDSISLDVPVLPTEKLSDEVVEETKEEVVEDASPVLPVQKLDDTPVTKEEVVSSPLTIDPETVASAVDKDGNGINDSLESSGVVDIFKDTTPVPETNSTLDYMEKNFALPVPSFDSRPIESYGASEFSMPVHDTMFSDVSKDRIPYGDDNNIMGDVVRSMSELMRQNREQRSTIVQYQERIAALDSQRRMAVEQYKQQAVRFEALSSKLRALEESTSRLEARNQMYEARIHDQEKVISSQDRELRNLRPQLEGKQDLVKLLADAKALLGDEGNNSSYSSYDDGSNYYRRVA